MGIRAAHLVLAAAAAAAAWAAYQAAANGGGGGGAHAALKAGLADATSGDSGEEANRWTAPSWGMAAAGVTPLRADHPLFRRPPYIGHARHQVMCNGWYYHSPENEVL
jgi:hypothetical protein